MEAINPTMGGAPVLVDKPTVVCDHRHHRITYYLERDAYEWFCLDCGAVAPVGGYEEPIWLTDGLSMPWIDVPQPKEKDK